MRVLVTGRNGQVARAIAALGLPDLVFAARPALDLARPETVEAVLAAVRPDVIVSAAAYTAVDRAEEEPALAMAVNAEAPGVIGRAAARLGARVIHLSTDHLFDGSGSRPWHEDDPVAPVNLYGRSKALGEVALRAAIRNHLILRTAWVHGPQGTNFVTTMLRLGRERGEVAVVADQFGCPTAAQAIARALAVILARWQRDPHHGLGTTFHFAGRGEASRAQLAQEVFRLASTHGYPRPMLRAIATADYPTRAARPANGRLDCSRFARVFGHRAPPWQRSLAVVIERLLSDGRGRFQPD